MSCGRGGFLRMGTKTQRRIEKLERKLKEQKGEDGMKGRKIKMELERLKGRKNE